MIGYIFSMLILIIMAIGGFLCYRHEKRVWNNGVCSQTGNRWIYFDIDSQGGRGYKSGNYYCWISYSVDQRGVNYA